MPNLVVILHEIDDLAFADHLYIRDAIPDVYAALFHVLLYGI